MRISKGWLLAGTAFMVGTLIPVLGLAQPANAAGGPGPTLTVVGYGLVNMTPVPSNSAPQQLQITLQASGANAPATLTALRRDASTVTRQLIHKARINARAITTLGPPNININDNGVEYQANETIEATFSSLTQLANALQASDVANDPGVQNVFANPLNASNLVASASALTAGYEAAFANAQQTAEVMAQADHLQLGQAVSVSESSASNGGCNAMGNCNPTAVGNPPLVGNNQELVMVTVTYDTGAS
jgi:uncharacterized protein YggE